MLSRYLNPVYTVTAAAVLAALSAAVTASAPLADVLAVLSLALVAVSAWDVEAGLGILVVFVPLRTLAGFIVPVPLRFVADTVVLTMALRLVLRHPETLLPLDWIESALALFTVVGLILTVHAHAHLSGAILELRDLMLFPLLYAVLRRLIRVGDGPAADWWARWLPAGLAVIGLVGVQGLLAQLVVHHPFAVPERLLVLESHVAAVNAGRPGGWLDNPNVFGQLGLFALILAYTHFRAYRFRPVWPFAILCVIFAAMVVFSFSRSAYLALILGAVVYAVAAAEARERYVVVGATAVMLAAVLVLPTGYARTVGTLFGEGPAVRPVATRRVAPADAPGLVLASAARPAAVHAAPRHRHEGPSGYLQSSARGGRLRTLRYALELIRRYPLGTGLGSFGSSGSKVFGSRLTRLGIPRSFYADDNYAVILVETGLPGFLLFLLAGIAVYATLWRRLRLSRHDAALVWLLFLSITLLGFTGDTWEQLNLVLYPWLVLGLSAGWAERQAAQGGSAVRDAAAATG